jgi:LPXTG-motif cell wall-anchored protein
VAAANGSFSIVVAVATTTSGITVSFGTTYPPTACAGVGVITHQVALTGSSNTPSYVLIGLAAVVLGLVLVVAARRRHDAAQSSG